MNFNNEANKDLGDNPVVLNIHKEICCNTNFRTTLWTGKHLQVTAMCIPIGGEVGLEIHEDVDQFLKIESGCAYVYMGKTKRDVKFLGIANQNSTIIIPAKTWHNIINAQNMPLKLYSIYAPAEHPFGTIHETKMDSDLAEYE